jgi:hypothetical protein
MTTPDSPLTAEPPPAPPSAARGTGLEWGCGSRPGILLGTRNLGLKRLLPVWLTPGAAPPVLLLLRAAGAVRCFLKMGDVQSGALDPAADATDPSGVVVAAAAALSSVLLLRRRSSAAKLLGVSFLSPPRGVVFGSGPLGVRPLQGVFLPAGAESCTCLLSDAAGDGMVRPVGRPGALGIALPGLPSATSSGTFDTVEGAALLLPMLPAAVLGTGSCCWRRSSAALAMSELIWADRLAMFWSSIPPCKGGVRGELVLW